MFPSPSRLSLESPVAPPTIPPFDSRYNTYEVPERPDTEDVGSVRPIDDSGQVGSANLFDDTAVGQKSPKDSDTNIANNSNNGHTNGRTINMGK